MFEIILDNNLKRSGIIFERVQDYVAGGLILCCGIMLSGLKHYNLLF